MCLPEEDRDTEEGSKAFYVGNSLDLTAAVKSACKDDPTEFGRVSHQQSGHLQKVVRLQSHSCVRNGLWPCCNGLASWLDGWLLRFCFCFCFCSSNLQAVTS